MNFLVIPHLYCTATSMNLKSYANLANTGKSKNQPVSGRFSRQRYPAPKVKSAPKREFAKSKGGNPFSGEATW